MELIDNKSISRAKQSFKCLPLNTTFYRDAQLRGLNAEKVFNLSDRYMAPKSKWFRTRNDVEAAFEWLIRIGILRREVDGQGLTSQVRMTPLGRKILEESPNIPNQTARFAENVITKIKQIIWDLK